MMITFSEDTPFLYIILITSCIALLFATWLAWQRSNRKRVYWRIMAVVTAVFSLAMLGLKPQLQQAVFPQEAILLTEGTREDSLRNLLSAFSKNKPAIFTADSSVNQQGISFSSTVIPDLAYLQRNHPQIRRLHVMGYGLSQTELSLLDSIRVVPHLSRPQGGIKAIHWRSKEQSGEQWLVQGSFENKSPQPVSLILEGFGMRMDSMEIPANSTKAFQLQTRLKETGRFVFELKQYVNKGLVQNEKIPVEVLPPSQLQVLLLEAFPGFEVKFLKNWLAGKQYAVAVRTAISKDKFYTEFINREKLNIEVLTTQVLENTDVVVADEQSLEELRPRETRLLEQAIQEKGIGLLIIRKEPERNTKNRLLSAFKVNAPASLEEKQTSLSWPDMPADSPALNIHTARIEYSSGTRSLLYDQKNGVLAAVRLWGSGRLAANLVQSSYIWQLDGKQELYANYWSWLLGNLVNKNVAAESWETDTDFPVINLPVTYTLHTQATSPPTGQYQNIPFYLAQHKLQPQQWQGTIWPDAAGWTFVQTPDGDPFWHYIFSPSDWKSIQLRQRSEATLNFVQTQPIENPESSVATSLFETKSISAIWFFLLFLCSMAYLWIEQKL